MKKLAIIIAAILLCIVPVKAQDGQPKQDTVNNQTYFTANLQKQPEEGKQKQRISNHFTFFTINVQINGKIKENEK